MNLFFIFVHLAADSLKLMTVLFAETDSNLKLEMLSQLLYDQPLTAEADAPKADKPKHPGGRPKKVAEKKDGESE